MKIIFNSFTAPARSAPGVGDNLGGGIEVMVQAYAVDIQRSSIF